MEGIARPRLDVRDLELVLALAKAGSTSKAAASLHVTQSAVSRGLLLAEGKLGARFFERTARGLVPTAVGQRLIDGAGTVLAQLVALEAQAESPEAERVRLRLVCECYTAYRWLPSTLARLKSALGSVDVDLMVEHTSAPVAALVSEAIDVALLTTSNLPARTTLEEMPLFADEIVFVVGRDHPLAGRPKLSRRDFAEFPLITSTQTPKPEADWFRMNAFGRTPPKVASIRFPLTEAIIDAARSGMGIAVMSEWIAQPYLDAGDVVAKRLEGKPLLRPWRIAFRREAAAGARRLAAALEHAAPRIHLS